MNWLLLVLSLATENATARMRVWRTLKASGAAVLRDGVYLLPAGGDQMAVFQSAAAEVEAAGGTAYALALGDDTDFHWEPLFDRTEEYAQLAVQADACAEGLARLDHAEAARQLRKLRKAFDSCVRTDFFANPARAQVEARIGELEARFAARLSPGEPLPVQGDIRRRDPGMYRGCIWTTRKRPWVDRLASAWLIRRHIDPQARFFWFDAPSACPPEAVGFDFDGAEFSHVGERVTFETLLASFGLEGNPALIRLARIVHFLDVGGLPAPEAAGLEALLSGMRQAISDDDSLLESACTALDFLHQSFQRTTE